MIYLVKYMMLGLHCQKSLNGVWGVVHYVIVIWT